MGKPRVIAETGAGQHGVATATVCARYGMECVVYMGSEDIKRQAQNVYRMKLLGATVVPVESGSRTLKDALNEAMRDWVTNIENTFYIIGTVAGPHPYPAMVRDFNSVVGKECLWQMPELIGRDPDYVIACVGGGSNAMGIFYDYIGHEQVKLVGVEAAGDGLDTGLLCALGNLPAHGHGGGDVAGALQAATHVLCEGRGARHYAVALRRDDLRVNVLRRTVDAQPVDTLQRDPDPGATRTAQSLGLLVDRHGYFFFASLSSMRSVEYFTPLPLYGSGGR